MFFLEVHVKLKKPDENKIMSNVISVMRSNRLYLQTVVIKQPGSNKVSFINTCEARKVERLKREQQMLKCHEPILH